MKVVITTGDEIKAVGVSSGIGLTEAQRVALNGAVGLATGQIPAKQADGSLASAGASVTATKLEDVCAHTSGTNTGDQDLSGLATAAALTEHSDLTELAHGGGVLSATQKTSLTTGLVADDMHRHLVIDVDVIAGEAAIAVGSPLALRYVNNQPAVKKAGATSGVGPFKARGIAVTAAAQIGDPLKMRVFGVSPVIPDDIWETFTVDGQPQGGVPAASRFGDAVYLGKTAGKVTWYRGTINPENGDANEFLGWIFSGDTGNARMFIFPTVGVSYSTAMSGYGYAAMSFSATMNNLTAAGWTLTTTATTGHWKLPTCPGVPTGVPVSGEGSQIIDSTTGHLWRWHGSAWVDKG